MSVETVAVDQDTAWNDDAALAAALREQVPRIPPVYGYDERGSQLFEDITRLPTYYLTRVEWALLRAHAAEIAAALDGARFAELGSGSGKKTHTLLLGGGSARPVEYLPIDVSRKMLQLCAAVADDLPQTRVRPLWGRYESGLRWLRDEPRDERLVIGFLGANAGNATPTERAALLADIAATLRPGDSFLVSVDLRKPATVFTTAYNDPDGAGAFADFRRNHLAHLNRRCGADFDLDRVEPRAHYDESTGEVLALLHVLTAHEVHVASVGVGLALRAGDTINVGISAKFDDEQWTLELAGHGLDVQRRWIAPAWRYGLHLAVRR